jgi:hypothetical protein
MLFRLCAPCSDYAENAARTYPAVNKLDGANRGLVSGVWEGNTRPTWRFNPVRSITEECEGALAVSRVSAVFLQVTAFDQES